MTWKSCLVLEGREVSIAVYEQSTDKERSFTIDAITTVCEELEAVLQHFAEIQQTGMLPRTSPFSQDLPATSYLRIEEYVQPGLCKVEGALNPSSRGFAYMRVYDGNVQIAPQEIEKQSLRFVGWRTTQDYCFPYTSRITLYGGTNTGQAESLMRFELWHRSDTGEETMMAEAKHRVRKWVR